MKRRTSARQWLLAPIVLLAAPALLWFGAQAHLRMACMVDDTPYLMLCPAPGSDDDARAQLRERIARDPGDSEAWVQLLMAENAEQSQAAFSGALALAPTDPDVLTRHAAAALQAGQLPQAVDLLIDNVRYRSNGASAEVLAHLLGTPEGMTLLRPHLDTADQWLPLVLNAMGRAKTPAPLALALVTQVQEKGRLSDAALHEYMHALKAGGYWVDAWGLWLAKRKGPVPLLDNGSFDDPFEQDGFGWEAALDPPSRAGVLMEQQPVAHRGLVLDLEFTGRPFRTPVLRQFVFAGPGSYRLQGAYMASKFRSEQGLVWSVVCTAGHKSVAGRSEPLQDTDGAWSQVELQFTIPPDCGPMASVQLEPAASFEANTGMRGEVALDAYTLTHAAPDER